MALCMYFVPQGMTPEKYETVHEQLAAAGQADPPGRTVHAGFLAGDGNVHVFDVWESQEQFDAFGEHLMPILAQNGIDAGEPRVAEVTRLDLQP